MTGARRQTVARVEADVEILSGNPDAADMAAITAVLAGVLEELAAEQGRRQQAHTSAWERSQRSVREPLHPGPGVWRSFSG
ncbi:MAG TPA: acyl-CoA carboxylase subunit epsilon [Galbitalea sp.]|nr:acyl-CoA carboxylase subunit epsilon [Galbitalea sp.]